MKLYIKSTSSYKGNIEDIELKKLLKTKYKLDTRRQDAFIHLAVYGAQMLKSKTHIDPNDELYITSGVGNIDVLQRTNRSVLEDGEFIKPFDFINMLGNTTSYYVATSLGLKDKNIFQISDRFTYIHTLISVFSSLNISKKDAIVGAIDLATRPDEVIKKVLGVDITTPITSSVNYQKLSLSPKDAIGTVEFDTKIYTLEEIQKILKTANCEVQVSMRCKELPYKKESEYFETTASFAINQAVEAKRNILYVECFDKKYKFIKVKAR